jgi:hypothetical protein
MWPNSLICWVLILTHIMYNPICHRGFISTWSLATVNSAAAPCVTGKRVKDTPSNSSPWLQDMCKTCARPLAFKFMRGLEVTGSSINVKLKPWLWSYARYVPRVVAHSLKNTKHIKRTSSLEVWLNMKPRWLKHLELHQRSHPFLIKKNKQN